MLVIVVEILLIMMVPIFRSKLPEVLSTGNDRFGHQLPHVLRRLDVHVLGLVHPQITFFFSGLDLGLSLRLFIKEIFDLVKL